MTTAGTSRASCSPQAPVLAKLHNYRATDGSTREIVLLGAAGGSRLVVDRRACDGDDARLLAHLWRDEPDENALHVSREYLADAARRCRPLALCDLLLPPEGTPGANASPVPRPAVLVDRRGVTYRLRATPEPAELRWHREDPGAPDGATVVSARDVVAALEDYEPVRALTRAAIEALRGDRRISIATLGLELRRLEASPIVLNRRLREAVLEAVRQRGVSLSAIAIACGRMKRDARGNGSGETSWLARRVGLVGEGSAGAHNPWVHSDTLALIARDGLGIAPHEVELG
ncbi:MAG: hypothetical protein ABSG64_07770 [Solirubrobacteraceae bacterium]